MARVDGVVRPFRGDGPAPTVTVRPAVSVRRKRVTGVGRGGWRWWGATTRGTLARTTSNGARNMQRRRRAGTRSLALVLGLVVAPGVTGGAAAGQQPSSPDGSSDEGNATTSISTGTPITAAPFDVPPSTAEAPVPPPEGTEPSTPQDDEPIPGTGRVADADEIVPMAATVRAFGREPFGDVTATAAWSAATAG